MVRAHVEDADQDHAFNCDRIIQYAYTSLFLSLGGTKQTQRMYTLTVSDISVASAGIALKLSHAHTNAHRHTRKHSRTHMHAHMHLSLKGTTSLPALLQRSIYTEGTYPARIAIAGCTICGICDMVSTAETQPSCLGHHPSCPRALLIPLFAHCTSHLTGHSDWCSCLTSLLVLLHQHYARQHLCPTPVAHFPSCAFQNVGLQDRCSKIPHCALGLRIHGCSSRPFS